MPLVLSPQIRFPPAHIIRAEGIVKAWVPELTSRGDHVVLYEVLKTKKFGTKKLIQL